jgi:hypothetical protein
MEALGNLGGCFGKNIFLHNGLALTKIGARFRLRALDLRKVNANLIGREYAPDLGNKPWQLPGKIRIAGRDIGKAHQLLANKIIESGRDPVSGPDGVSGLALLHPDAMSVTRVHCSLPISALVSLLPAIRSASTSNAALKHC